MTYKEYHTLLGAAKEENDPDRFLAEWSSSNIFYPDPEKDGLSPDCVAADLQNIWEVAHLTIRDVIARSGLSQTAFAIRFCIPLRTVQGWALGERNCPYYICFAIADLLGMVKVERS